MPDYYIDSTDGNDLNNGLTVNTPFKTINKAITVLGIGSGGSAKQASIFLKRGSTFTEKLTLYFGGLSETQLLTIEAYGFGPKPVINFAAGGQTRGISIAATCGGFFKFKDFAITGTGAGVEYGVLYQRTLSTDEAYTIFDGVDVYDIRDTNNPASDRNGLMLRGNNFIFKNMTVYNIATDGIWVAAANLTADNLNIYNVSTDGRGLGDCFQISGPCNFLVENCIFDHSSNSAKQAFIISGANAGSGGILRNCKLIMKPATAGENCYPLYVDQPNVTVERCLITGGNTSTSYNMANFTSGATGADIKGNIFVASIAGSQGLVIDANNAKARNNTVINTGGNSGTGYGIGQANTGRTGLEVINNIVVGFARGIQKHTGSSWIESNNVLYNNTVSISNEAGVSQALGSGDVIADPLLDSNYIPQPPSPALSSGLKYWNHPNPTNWLQDSLPRLETLKIDIGAIQTTQSPFHPINL